MICHYSTFIKKNKDIVITGKMSNPFDNNDSPFKSNPLSLHTHIPNPITSLMALDGTDFYYKL